MKVEVDLIRGRGKGGKEGCSSVLGILVAKKRIAQKKYFEKRLTLARNLLQADRDP